MGISYNTIATTLIAVTDEALPEEGSTHHALIGGGLAVVIGSGPCTVANWTGFKALKTVQVSF